MDPIDLSQIDPFYLFTLLLLGIILLAVAYTRLSGSPSREHIVREGLQRAGLQPRRTRLAVKVDGKVVNVDLYDGGTETFVLRANTHRLPARIAISGQQALDELKVWRDNVEWTATGLFDLDAVLTIGATPPDFAPRVLADQSVQRALIRLHQIDPSFKLFAKGYLITLHPGIADLAEITAEQWRTYLTTLARFAQAVEHARI
ncbi:MAG: hypothetical protein GYB68_07595 [Chloroflexi bacterium]|nr:hypothetical protein [Chloroflexota bacterium]